MHTLDKTSRLQFSAIKQADALELFEGAFSNPSVTEYLQWDYHKDVAETESLVHQMVQLHESGDKSFWVARHIKEGSIVGLGSMKKEAYAVSIGFLVCSDFQRRGYATEIITALHHRSNAINYPIQALVDPLNKPSSKLLEKLGWINSGPESGLNIYKIN